MSNHRSSQKKKPINYMSRDWEDTRHVVMLNKADVHQLPEYLTKLYEESCKKNPCGEEKIKLEKYCLRTRMHLL